MNGKRKPSRLILESVVSCREILQFKPRVALVGE